MSAVVPPIPAYSQQTYVRGGLPVKSLTMTDAANAAMWAMGNGSQVVPFFSPLVTVAASGTATFRFRVVPRYQAFIRMWCFSVTSTAAGGTTYTATAPTGGSYTGTFSAFSSRDITSPSMLAETVASQSSSEQEISIKFVNTGADSMVIESIGCWEVPRVLLTLGGNDGGVNLDTLAQKAPIYIDTGKSIGGLAATVDKCLTSARRTGMFQHSFSDESLFTTTSTSYGRVFATSRNPIFLGRSLYRADTVRTITFGVYAKVSTATGSFKVTMTNGDSVTISVTGTSLAWYTGQVDVDAEDLSTSDGRRGSSWDEATIEMKMDSAGTMSLASISAWEP